jgi:hypothetical protein
LEDINQFKKKLENMSASELFGYVKENYPENEELGIGSKKIIIRRILNLERNLMNELERSEQ